MTQSEAIKAAIKYHVGASGGVWAATLDLDKLREGGFAVTPIDPLPQNIFDMKSPLDAAQIAFETLMVEGHLTPREQTRLRLAAAIRAAATPEAMARIDEMEDRKS